MKIAVSFTSVCHRCRRRARCRGRCAKRSGDFNSRCGRLAEMIVRMIRPQTACLREHGNNGLDALPHLPDICHGFCSVLLGLCSLPASSLAASRNIISCGVHAFLMSETSMDSVRCRGRHRMPTLAFASTWLFSRYLPSVPEPRAGLCCLPLSPLASA